MIRMIPAAAILLALTAAPTSAAVLEGTVPGKHRLVAAPGETLDVTIEAAETGFTVRTKRSVLTLAAGSPCVLHKHGDRATCPRGAAPGPEDEDPFSYKPGVDVALTLALSDGADRVVMTTSGLDTYTGFGLTVFGGGGADTVDVGREQEGPLSQVLSDNARALQLDLFGGEGGDSLTGRAGWIVASGGNGADSLALDVLSLDFDGFVDGGEGADQIDVSGDTWSVDGGGGDDRINAPDTEFRINGDDGNDVLVCGEVLECEGGRGNDEVRGGQIIAAGGPGADVLISTASQVFGGCSGYDSIPEPRLYGCPAGEEPDLGDRVDTRGAVALPATRPADEPSVFCQEGHDVALVDEDRAVHESCEDVQVRRATDAPALPPVGR